MPAPTSYTEAQLAEYLHRVLGHTATGLGWSYGPEDAGDYQEVVNDALIAMGLADIASVPSTRIGELRILSQLHLWRAVVAATAGDFDFSADGGSYSRRQAHENAQNMLAQAERSAAAYDPAYSVIVGSVTYSRDPLGDIDDPLTDSIDDWIEQWQA